MYYRYFSTGLWDVSLAGGQRLVKLSEWITEMMQHGDQILRGLGFFFPLSKMFWLFNSKELSIFTFSDKYNT